MYYFQDVRDLYKVRLYFVLSSLMFRRLLIETVFESIIFLEHDILALVNVGVSQLAGRFGTIRGEVCQGSGTNNERVFLGSPRIQQSFSRERSVLTFWSPLKLRRLNCFYVSLLKVARKRLRQNPKR